MPQNALFAPVFAIFLSRSPATLQKKIASTYTKMPIFCLKIGAPKQLQKRKEMRKIVSKVSPKQFREIVYRQIMKKNRTRELDTMPIPKISAKHISTKLVAIGKNY